MRKKMKRVLGLVVICLVLVTSVGFAGEERIKYGKKIFTAVALNNSSATSEVFNLQSATRGIRSISYVFNTTSTHADARINLDFYISPTGVTGTYARSTDGYSILSAVHEGSGTDNNGIDTVKFEPTLAGYIYFVITETATQAAVLDVYYNRQ